MFKASVKTRSSSRRFRGGHGWYFRLPMGDGNSAGWIYQTSVWLVEVGVQVFWLWRSAMLSAETGRALIWQSVFPFRQKVLKLETLVQSSSHDFGEHLEIDVFIFLHTIVFLLHFSVEILVWIRFKLHFYKRCLCTGNCILTFSGQASSLHYEAEELRQQCVLFFNYVKVFIHRYAVYRAHPEIFLISLNPCCDLVVCFNSRMIGVIISTDSFFIMNSLNMFSVYFQVFGAFTVYRWWSCSPL